jgi:hypothetical protein
VLLARNGASPHRPQSFHRPAPDWQGGDLLALTESNTSIRFSPRRHIDNAPQAAAIEEVSDAAHAAIPCVATLMTAAFVHQLRLRER